MLEIAKQTLKDTKKFIKKDWIELKKANGRKTSILDPRVQEIFLKIEMLSNFKNNWFIHNFVNRRKKAKDANNIVRWPTTTSFQILGVSRIFKELQTVFSRSIFFKDLQKTKPNRTEWRYQKFNMELWHIVKNDLFTIREGN